MKNAIDKFVEQLKIRLGINLRSVLLYGSMASGEQVKRHSDINILIVSDKMDLETLRNIADIKRNPRFGKIAPLILTKNYLDSSTDTFPIEFLDMKENYSLLFGEDCLKNLKVRLSNLRHQCEWELKSKIIQMQKFYVNSRHRNKALKTFLLKTLPSFIIVFKNILRLKGVTATGKNQILDRISDEFSLDKEFLNNLLNAWLGESKINNAPEAFGKFLFQLQRLSEAVDKLPAE